jgi:hypothetical protein
MAKYHVQFSLSSACVAIIVLTQFAACVLAKSNSKVWLLKQSGLIMGAYDVYVSDAGLRAHSLKSKLVIIAKPPDWRIIAYNADAKTTWTGSIDQFHPTASGQRFLTMASGIPALNAAILPQHREYTELGLKGIQFYTDTHWEEAQKALLRRNLITKDYPAQATYFGATSIAKVAPPCKILEHLFDVPSKGLVPIAYRFKKLSDGKQDVLTTLSAKEIVPPVDWLDVPKGLRKVATMEEVNRDLGAQQGIDQMLDNIPVPK